MDKMIVAVFDNERQAYEGIRGPSKTCTPTGPSPCMPML
jgi:hypothetical protein